MPLRLDIVTSRASTSTEDSDATYSTGPPTYTSSVTGSPTYTSSPQSNFSLGERGSSSIDRSPSSPSSPTSWEMLDTARTSPIDISSSSGTSLEGTMPSGAPERYIYYRLYTEDRAIPSLHPLYKNDLYLGCVLATSVAPPHTTADIKRYLCKVEKITSPATSCLFIASSEQISIDDDTRVAILAFGGPGSTPDQPLALVFKLPAAEVTSRKMAKLRALMQPAAPLEPRYLYYRLYAEDGEVRCKSAKLTKPYLGRINVDLVVPPHTVASLKRCITAVEGNNGFLESHLYVDLDSLSPMDEGPISILTGDCPGCTSEKPMALLYSTSRAETPTGHSNFTIPIKGKQDCEYSSFNPSFLDFKKDEILHTDGRSRSETFRGVGGGRRFVRRVTVFQAANAAGSMGFVMKNTVEICR